MIKAKRGPTFPNKLQDELVTSDEEHHAHGNEGKVNIVFTVVKREVLGELIPTIKEYNPKAFFTIEGVKKVSGEEVSFKENKGVVLGKMLNFKRR